MWQRLFVLAVLALALPAGAVTNGLTLLPTGTTGTKPAQAKFAIGLTVDGGKSWQTTANLNQGIVLKASIDADPAHVRQKADVFVVQWTGGKFTMYSGGVWQDWSGKIPDLKPMLEGTTLEATQELTIYQGGISVEGDHSFYVGYLPANDSALVYSNRPATFHFAAAPADPFAFFQDQVFTPIIVGRLCITCHVDGGAADASKLHLNRDTSKVQQNYDIFNTFFKSRSDAYDYILTKVTGGNNHGGGQPLPLGSSGYQTMAGFLDLLGGGSQSVSVSKEALFDGVTLQSPVDTLRDAALLLAGRLPTAAETAAVAAGGDAALRPALLALMQGPQFHRFLKDGADDRLFLRGNEDLNLADDCPTCFPALNNQYWVLKDKADQSGTAVDRGLLNLFMNQVNYSLLESPLELIAYVVEHDKPYSEILTADYDMLTPVLNGVVGGTATFPAGAANTDFAPGKITDYHLRDATSQVQGVPGAALPRIITPSKLVMTYPQVGLLNAKSFLSRYPTTATNRNRARARWTYYNFLGIDIEALAKRTTDPVALADTNNPTMNNPACTVCHSVLDPVAGTFQDYADNGIYRSALNGTDSLDNTYKRQTNPRLYVTGDTWYRDMRQPGFESTTATGNTLRWLATQIVKDRRFAVATVRFWWPAVIGTDLLHAPEVAEDANYQARLSAYEAQQATIEALADKFVQSGLSVKNLLADLVLSQWYRADKLASGQVSAVQSSARVLASVSGEKLLTPEELSRKTKALTGFNWNAQVNATTGDQVSGLENDYNTFYGGIDGFALKVRARALTPMMSNVAAAHAMESACPVVLGDFIRPEEQRLLFGGFSPWVTPLTEQVSTQQMTSTSDTDFKSYALAVELAPGIHQVVLSLLNDACDYATSPTTCRNDKNLVINTVTVTAPDGQSTTFNGNRGSFGSCASVTNTTRATLYASCTATYNYTAALAGNYTVNVSLAAKQQASDPVLAGINVEATVPAAASATAGAALIKQKLVELHGKLLGQTVTATSPEVQASWDLLVQTWLARKAGSATPSLLQSKTLACDWSTDIGFVGTLNYPGSPLLANGRYNTTPVTNWLLPQAQDALLMKQSWAVVMAYLLSHYDYLHE